MTNKAEVVHAQLLSRQPPLMDSLLTIGRLSHASFATLRECYHRENYALMWEPVGLSASQLLALNLLMWPVHVVAGSLLSLPE